MDISELCRSCMKAVSTWESTPGKRTVEMFSFCTNIKISENDPLPKHFCEDCLVKIESAYTFITEAQKVNVTFKNYISRNETSVIVEPELNNRVTNLKLTLPEYKVCTTADNLDNIPLFDNETQSNCKDEDTALDNDFDYQDVTFNEKIVEETIKREDSCNETENTNAKKNICPVCRKAFSSKVWFTKHMEKEHTGNSYTCTKCPKSFSSPSRLRRHSLCHGARRLACAACGARFVRSHQLAAHARAHSDERPFACDRCQMRFKKKSVLKCHLKIHEGQKQYLCSICGSSFSQAGNLSVHMRTHSGEKPFACAQCGFRAAAASNLRRHQRAHGPARTHACERCDKAFCDASALARHRRTHTGELPYQCPGCARAFADSWKRKTHLMRAHRLALADIPRMRRDGRPVLPGT